MKLSGKKAIVTGASSNIGKAIALAYAKEGAELVISYQNDEKGALETVREIEKLGRSAKAIQADFSHSKDVELFFHSALASLSKIDLLVNNAAGYDKTSFLELSVPKFGHLFNIGVAAPMLLTQLTAAHMIKEKISGSILNISSISGARPHPNRVAHSNAKAALNMLTRSTALELAPYNIRVNALAPGYTPHDASTSDEKIINGIPLKRAGTAMDQAYAAVYLASDEASWITGQILTIDGGQSLAS